MSKILLEDVYSCFQDNNSYQISNMNSEFTLAKDKIYFFQDTDGILKPISFATEQLAEIDIPVQSKVENYHNSVEQSDENGTDAMFSSETEPNSSAGLSIENVQIIEPSSQNILVAQSITNLIPITQNVRLFAIDDGAAAKVCRPVFIKKRLISVPSQNVPLLGQMPVALVEAGESSYQSGIIKIITSEQIREDKLSQEPSNSLSGSFKVQIKKKVTVENKPDLILSANGVNSPKPNFNFQIINAAQSSRDIQKYKATENHTENGKRTVLNQCKELPKRTNASSIKKEPHTTIHLLQNGNEYQSVEQLDEDKLKLVSGAINRIVNKKAPKNTVIYDPTSKTKIIYRVVYPEDLNLSTKSNNSSQPNKPVLKRAVMKQPKDSSPSTSKIMSVTRSGRVVKVPRHMDDDEFEPLSPQSLPKPALIKKELSKDSGVSECSSTLGSQQKQKRKCAILARRECSKCEKVFRGCKRINQHYLEFPDHKVTSPPVNTTVSNWIASSASLPTVSTVQACTSSTIKANVETGPMIAAEESHNKMDGNRLFECLVSVLESTDLDKRATSFVRELEGLVLKLRGLVPCISKVTDGSSGTQCTVNECVARLLDITSGSHYFDMGGIKCGSNGLKCQHRNLEKAKVANDTSFARYFETSNDTQKKLCECAKTNSFDKWLLDVSKNRELVTSPQKSQNDQTKVCWSTLTDAGNLPVTFSTPSSNERLLTTDTISQKVSSLEKNTFSETWMQDVASCVNTDKLAPLTSETHHNGSIEPQVSSNMAFFNNLDQQFAYVTSNMNIPMDISRKSHDNGIESIEQNNIEEKYTFQNSHFKFDSARMNGDHGSFEKLDLNQQSLPSFMKIDRHNLHLPSASLDDIVTSQINNITTAAALMSDPTSTTAESNRDLRNISTNDVLTSIQSPKLRLESLNRDYHLPSQMTISRSHHMDSVTRDSTTREDVTLETNDNACDERPLMSSLSTSISETPLGRSETLLSINDSSLDSTRLNLSGNQSVLQLLDPLGTDCLSFSDSELRPTSQMSLDLNLDLFPFHHT